MGRDVLMALFIFTCAIAARLIARQACVRAMIGLLHTCMVNVHICDHWTKNVLDIFGNQPVFDILRLQSGSYISTTRQYTFYFECE